MTPDLRGNALHALVKKVETGGDVVRPQAVRIVHIGTRLRAPQSQQRDLRTAGEGQLAQLTRLRRFHSDKQIAWAEGRVEEWPGAVSGKINSAQAREGGHGGVCRTVRNGR